MIGTERHEARRIDRQLRGRAGRQGDPGASRFFLSLEDDLMRLFGSERIAAIMDRLGAEEGEVIEHSMVTRSIERAQKKVEARNFDMRKHLLEYDDVMNQQRQVIYNRRRDAGARLGGRPDPGADHPGGDAMGAHADPDTAEEWPGRHCGAASPPPSSPACPAPLRSAHLSWSELRDVTTSVQDAPAPCGGVGAQVFREIEKAIYLHTIDTAGSGTYAMDELKEGIGLWGSGKNP